MKTSSELYIRRCHVCNQISFGKGTDTSDLAECSHCHKIFIPFLFFNDLETEALSDNEPRPDGYESYLPIRGFTSYW